MEISGKFKEQSTVFMAVITLAIIGCSLLASTWQNMLHQKAAEEQHLYLISRSVLLALESSLRRGPVRISADNLSPRTVEIFESLEEDGEILFAGIIDQRGGRMLTSPPKQEESISLPKDVMAGLLDEGQWSGRLRVDGKTAYVSGKLLAPIRGEILTLHESPRAPVFLLVGIDTESYLSLHKGFRKNIMLQAGYILVAALVCWFFAFSFLSRREQARRAETLERFQDKLLDNLPDGLVTLSEDYAILSANPAALRILNPGQETLVGRQVTELPGVVSDAILRQCSLPGKEGWQRVGADNRYFEVLVLPIFNDAGSFMVIVRDRTQLRLLEQNLADAEKLAMVGTLAAGVAHEVRNPLSSLRGFAQYFLKKLSGRHPEEEYARTMVNEADRLNRVITDLLFLAKPKRIAPKPLDLSVVVEEIRTLLRFDLEQKNMEIETDLKETVLYADEDALKQSLLNLLLNSLDAVSPPCAPIAIVSGRDGKAVWVEVRDDGCGMTGEQRAQAFEPFFTAKTRGTGLGLALVQRTMTDHGGTASIASEPGNGCAIRLTFPDARDILPEYGQAYGQKTSGGPASQTGNVDRAGSGRDVQDSGENGRQSMQLSLMHEDDDE